MADVMIPYPVIRDALLEFDIEPAVAHRAAQRVVGALLDAYGDLLVPQESGGLRAYLACPIPNRLARHEWEDACPSPQVPA